MTRCIDCRWLAGAEGRQKLMWLYAKAQWFCLHPDREGGQWNVLQDVMQPTQCKRQEPAQQQQVDNRLKAIEILRKRYEKASSTHRSHVA